MKILHLQCGMTVGSTEEAINQGWIPYLWEGNQEKDGPFYASFSESLIHTDEDGEFVVKEDYAGKINYQCGDFSEEEHRTVGLVLEYSEN